MIFTQPLDIAKRALQHLGQPTIASMADNSRQAVEITACYDKLRQAELRAAPWNFAARRAVLRPRTSTTFRITPLPWAAGTTYAVGDVVSDTASVNYWWISTTASNLANTPGLTDTLPYWIPYFGPLVADLWASGKFFAGDVAYKTGSPAKAYIATPAVGTNVTTQDPASGAPWHEIAGATVAAMTGFEPIGVWLAPDAAATTATQRSIYDLPANFMRIAAQDDKIGGTPRQMITAGMQFNDFEIEGKLIYSSDTGPKIFRFTADHTDVYRMEPLFCELLALSIAREVCMILTGNRELEAVMETRYQDRLDDARTISLIEGGSSELPPHPAPQQPATQSRGAAS